MACLFLLSNDTKNNIKRGLFSPSSCIVGGLV